ncbi:hypothetical protein MMC16_007419 [Acarospora aff. strigata]|nr:hypothetical protein [Acarospora aff. strigata]
MACAAPGRKCPAFFNCDGWSHNFPDIGTTTLEELQPGDFLYKLRSANPDFGKTISPRLIGAAFTKLVWVRWGSDTSPPAKQAFKEWRRKLKAYRKQSSNKVNVGPPRKDESSTTASGQQQDKLERRDMQAVTLDGKGWNISSTCKIPLPSLTLERFGYAFFTWNKTLPWQDFTASVLLQAFEGFVRSAYPGSSSADKDLVLQRTQNRAARKFLSNLKEHITVGLPGVKARSRRQRRFIQSTKRITATKDGARDSSVVTDNGKEAECQDNIQGVAAAADSSDEASTSDNHESNSEEDVGSCMSVVDDRTADTQSDSSTESMDMGQGMVDTTNDTDEETSDDTRTESEEDVIGEPPNVTANCRSSSRAASETEVQSTVSIESEEADKMSSSQESPAENVNSHKRQHKGEITSGTCRKLKRLRLGSDSNMRSTKDGELTIPESLYGPGRDIFSALEDWLDSVS